MGRSAGLAANRSALTAPIQLKTFKELKEGLLYNERNTGIGHRLHLLKRVSYVSVSSFLRTNARALRMSYFASNSKTYLCHVIRVSEPSCFEAAPGIFFPGAGSGFSSENIFFLNCYRNEMLKQLVTRVCVRTVPVP